MLLTRALKNDEKMIEKAMLKKVSLLSVQLVAAVSAIRIIYGLITQGDLTYNNVLTASFWVGALLIISGICIFITPAFLLLRKSSLIDRTTYDERNMEARAKNNLRAYEHIFTGICIILIAGMIQFIAWNLF